jgi:hypothetical protein
MEPMLFILIPLALAVIGLVAYFAWKAEKQRREALAALAARLGWRFDPQRDRHHDDEYAHFEIFRRGHSRAAYNTLTGTVEIDGRSYPAKMGDFTYKVTRHSGKTTHTRTYRFSYLILHLPFAGVPDLLIRHEGFFDKVAGAFGFDDIDFESAEFSRRFCVKSPDKKFAYDVIHPRMMEFLMAGDAGTIDIERGRCCLSDGRHRWTPEQFEPKITWLRQFFDLWPDHVTASLEDRTWP